MSSISRLSLRMGMGMGASAGSSSSAGAASRLAVISRHLSTSPAAAKESKGATTPASPTKMSAPHEDVVLFESHQNARVYKLNRPSKLNSANQEMIDVLAAKLKNWRELESVKVIIGTGDNRAFCAGGDVKQLVLDLKAGKQTSLPFFKSEFELNWLLGRLGKPYVAVIDGVTMGGGAGLSLPAAIRIATPRTIFAMPETKIGYAPDVGANYYLSQLDGAVGAWLTVTGQELYGRAVYDLGIATHYVTPNLLPEIIHQITQLESPTVPLIANIVSSYTAAATPTTSESSSKTSPDGPTPIKGEIREFLDKTFGLKSIGEIDAALSKAVDNEKLSAEVREWAKTQKDIMSQRSPTGMAVALVNHRKAKEARRLDRSLLNDISMATAFCGSKRATEDFITGVSAVLIDRSKSPTSWIPAKLSDPLLAPSTINQNFFSSSSGHLVDRPTLEFQPASASKLDSGRDSTWGQFRKYGLPSEESVRAAVDGYAPGSGAFALKEQELVEQFVDAAGQVKGTRREEVEGRVREVVKKHCKKDKDGYLDWKS
ncbi:hypothetical protein CI109_101701 [Kwoniella shandongensis]|uniref:3-hydroxyisobutyryl-CoA hydrolase n=1 Tax=Kwoniella shandongensis TaxID=1734106 RepID=A0A5M6C5U1_9TREE|nr:uncharacterized protein CI109_001176 [Kwoniella shandongensis]KAA5530373.1 hypothetical protein CI109_001176 [Kwoniella shandongensis]